MPRQKSIQNMFKPDVPVKKHNPTQAGQAGFDNARENIDPHIKTKVIETKEGSIQTTPTNEKDLVNKEYVDDIATRSSIELFLTENGSADIGSYFDLEVDVITAAKEDITQSITANSTTLIASFASILDEEEIDEITLLESGVYSLHIHAEAAVAKGLFVYCEFYRREAGGTEHLLGTTHISDELTTSEAQYDVHATIADDTAWVAGDRFVIKVYGDNENAAARNIKIYMEGDTVSRTEFPGFISQGNNVRASLALTDETIVQGDGGGKHVKTSTATIANIESNTSASHAEVHNMASHSDDDTYNINTSGTATFGGKVFADATPIGIEVLRSAFVGINLEVVQNITVGGLVDGIDVGVDVAANTLKVSYTDAADVTLNTADRHGVNDANSSSEPLKGADDNYVTDAEKTVIGNTSGTNTGDNTTHADGDGSDHANVASNTSNLGYHDRGDPANHDFTNAWTEDNTWQDVDLSGIVPAGAKAVHFVCHAADNTVGALVSFKKKGNSANDKALAYLRIQVAGVFNTCDLTVACDTNRFIQFRASEAIDTCIVTIKGWWM